MIQQVKSFEKAFEDKLEIFKFFYAVWMSKLVLPECTVHFHSSADAKQFDAHIQM